MSTVLTKKITIVVDTKKGECSLVFDMKNGERLVFVTPDIQNCWTFLKKNHPFYKPDVVILN